MLACRRRLFHLYPCPLRVSSLLIHRSQSTSPKDLMIHDLLGEKMDASMMRRYHGFTCTVSLE